MMPTLLSLAASTIGYHKSASFQKEAMRTQVAL